jgi:ureidoglycolate hydrolase
MPIPLAAEWITAEAFRPYGQLIRPISDDTPFNDGDAQLQLDRGTPRFYLMRLPYRGFIFDALARHCLCTQCLGSLAGKEWAIAVAPPSATDTPDRDRLKAFRIPGDCFIKLEAGTWHAGPYFAGESADFYNLELSDTNAVDRGLYSFGDRDGLEFEIAIVN